MARVKLVERKVLVPFVVVTSLFALWGFANDITNPMVAAFSTVMEISNVRASLIQFAFYGGYATMAIPAALFVQRFNYKKGIVLGLAFYAVGTLLFFPAAHYQVFEFFLLALYVMTFGLAFLETTANPYILSLGAKESATRRLNLAQAFNPLGSLLGMFVASRLVLASLQSDQRDPLGVLIFPGLDEAAKAAIRTNDLLVIRDPYLVLGLVVVVVLGVVLFTRMPDTTRSAKVDFWPSVKRLYNNKIYRYGVVAQVFYVAAQIMCWTFIIHYADHLGIDKARAQLYNMVAMGAFLCSRFVGTLLMRYINARQLLLVFALAAASCIVGAVFLEGMAGLWSLVATSAFMSLMFPTIYGIALEDVGQDTTLGAAGLVMAIVGGALMPPCQGAIIDLGQIGSFPAVKASFVLPLICFLVIARFASYCRLTRS